MDPSQQPPQGYPGQAPPGQYPPQQGSYPGQQPPQGQYPPQQGQFPPPQGQYPPQQGPYPPQPMQMSMPQQPNTGGDLLQGLMAYPSLLVKQKPRGLFLEMCCNFEVRNEYGVYNPMSGNGKVLTAVEESTCFQRQCCGNSREFVMSINTIDGREVVRYERPLHFRQGGCFGACFFLDFCFQVIRVYAGKDTATPNKFLGYIREDYSFCKPVFSVFNENDERLYQIIGECCGCYNYTMHVHKNPEEPAVGVIQKRWAGFGKEWFTDADNFFITFPNDSDANARSLLLGATFLLDFLYFEKSNNNNH